MHHIHALIVDLTLITIYAGITTLICKKLKQPIVLGYVVAGILAGPFFNLLPTVSDRENLTLWADIGVIFLLFGLGLEFSFKKMMNVGKAAMITANANILFMLYLGYSTGILLGWSTMDSFFLGSMISMSSTTIIIKAFDDLNVKKQRFTDLVFGVLVVEDIMGILMLVLLPTIALGNSIDGGELLISTLKLISFLVLCFVSGIYLVPTFLKRIEGFLTDEMLLLITISLCFGMVYMATYSGFSAALGAFIMGSILAESSLIHRIERNIQPIKDFFGAVFFVSVGMMVDPSMFVEFAWPIFLITLIVIAGKVAFSCLGFIISGQPVKTAILCGFSLAQVGEFAFIIASLGLSLKVLDARVYPIIVAVSVITTFLTPMMIKAAGPFYQFVLRAAPKSWQAYISRTEKEVKVSPSEERLWTELFKNYLLRMILFSMILYTIILLSGHYLQPLVAGVLPGIGGRVVMTAVTLIAMAPFLKALIGWEAILPAFLRDTAVKVLCKIRKPRAESVTENSWVKKVGEKFDFCGNWGENAENVKNFFISNSILAKIYYKLWISKKTNRLPLVLMTSFRLLVVAFFIVMVVHKFLTEDAKVSLLLLLISVIVLAQSKWLLTQYMKIEAQFLANLRGHHGEKAEPSEKADDKQV
jgi:hypothetical protein